MITLYDLKNTSTEFFDLARGPNDNEKKKKS